MKFAFIVQRYGEDIIGGAENLARQIAERLALNNQVDVYTTTAKSYRSWRNQKPRGYQKIAGVNVYRFNTIIPRIPIVFSIYHRLTYKLFIQKKFKFPKIIQNSLESIWLVLQGPWCPRLIKELKSKQLTYDRIFFFTYLYYPTIKGLEQINAKTVLIPSAHDEPPIYFHRIVKALNKAHFIFYNTKPEAQILRTIIENFDRKSKQIGIGVEPYSTSQNGDDPNQNPYILYLGRLTKAKGVDTLILYFNEFVNQIKNSGIQLYLAGQIEKDLKIPSTPNIKYLGQVSENEKFNLIQNAIAVVNPSPHESLSLVLLEALVLKRPILVNNQCAVLASFCEKTKTVFAFSNSQEFRDLVCKISDKAWQISAQNELEESRQWVLKEYNWQKIVDEYQKTIPC